MYYLDFAERFGSGMEQKTINEKKWYAVYTASRAEKKVKERFEEMGITCYLPLQTVTRIWSDRKKKVEIPIINGYIFVYIHLNEIKKIHNTLGVAFLLKEKGIPVAIPDEQIDILRFMVDHSEEQVEFSIEDFSPGTTVIVRCGQLEGLIGELVEVRGKYKVLLRLENLGNVMVTIPISMIKTYGK